jgi:hypothetical protein
MKILYSIIILTLILISYSYYSYNYLYNYNDYNDYDECSEYNEYNEYSEYTEIKNNKILTYLDGYWISNSEFNELSDIDNMILYIDYKNKNGYLIIVSNNKIVAKEEFKLQIDNEIKYKNNLYNNLSFNCEFIHNDEFIWSKLKFKCILSINNGNIKLFNNNTLYGDLYKDNMITSYINNLN